MPGIIGKKLGMSQIFKDNGDVIPVTFIQVSPNKVVQLKTEEKDGYNAIVLAIDSCKKPSKTKKFKTLKEFKNPGDVEYKKDEDITIETLKDISEITVSSTSKGKGFQGTMKKYNFGGGPKTHGSTFHRKPGSVGACAEPGRVHKGKKLPGQMGNEKVTLRNRKVIVFDPENMLIAIKGPIPGPNNSVVSIQY